MHHDEWDLVFFSWVEAVGLGIVQTLDLYSMYYVETFLGLLEIEGLVFEIGFSGATLSSCAFCFWLFCFLIWYVRITISLGNELLPCTINFLIKMLN